MFRRGAADRNTGQCRVFRSCSGRGRTETQDSVLCSGRVLAFMAQGPGEAQPYIGLLPRAGRSCCVVSAPRLHRLPHHPLHGRGAGCVLQSPLYPLWRLQCFLGQTGSNQTKGGPPSFTTGHIVHLAHDPCVKGEGGQPWFVLFMCFRLKTGQNWPANARVNGYRVLAIQTGPARTEGSIKSH